MISSIINKLHVPDGYAPFVASSNAIVILELGSLEIKTNDDERNQYKAFSDDYQQTKIKSNDSTGYWVDTPWEPLPNDSSDKRWGWNCYWTTVDVDEYLIEDDT